MLVLGCDRPQEDSVSRPFTYDGTDVTRFLRKRNISVGTIDEITRNNSGDELFVVPFGRESNSYEAFRITTNGVSHIKSPSRRPFAPFDGEFCAWLTTDGQAVKFRGGQSIDLPPFGLFDLDSSGRYFIVGEKPHRTWIGRVESPQNRVLIAQDILGTRVFAKGKLVYICGIAYGPELFSRPPGSAVCLVLEDEGNRFVIKARHTFDWSAAIVDLDPDSERLLLCNKADAFRAVYLVDLVTKKRNRVGRATGFEFFLRHDLLKN
jgi:hypothetical protein